MSAARRERRAWTRAVKNLAWREEHKRVEDRRWLETIGYMSATETPIARWLEQREVEDRAAIRLRQELGVPFDDLQARLPITYSWDDD